MDSCGCDGATVFDRRTAVRDLDRYRRTGPDRTTRLLLDMIGGGRVAGSTVLDIGAGVGVIDGELIRRGADRAVLVDASPAYLEQARQEAARTGLLDRMEFVDGDFVRQAAGIDPADIVTLDRVVCCYRDADALVASSAARARRVYGLVLPRDRRLVRLAVALLNVGSRIARRATRVYAHPNGRIDDLVAAAGLRPTSEATTFFWRVVVYGRDGASAEGATPSPAGRP